MQQKLGIAERRACKALGQSRGTQRRTPKRGSDEAALTSDITKLALQYGRYGYKRITALLRTQGWVVNHKRVERIWRQEGLKVPQKHKKKGRLYLNDGSCIRLRPCWQNHVWSYDFVAERLKDGEPPPIKESISGVNPDKLWTTLRRYRNGTEALYGGADYRLSAAG